MSARFINPVTQYSDDAGKPIIDGLLNFYESKTLTRKDTFADINLKIPNDNPVEVFADGRIPNIFYAGSARVILTSQAGQEYDKDPVGTSATGAAFEIWNAVIEYEIRAIVEGSDGEYYRSLTDNNIGNDPTVSETSWERVQFLRTWNTNVTYAITEIVVASDGKIFTSLQNGNIGNDPTTPSPAFWENAIGNPFDQDLNTTDSVQFDTVNIPNNKSYTGMDTGAANRILIKMRTDDDIQVGSSSTVDVKFSVSGSIQPTSDGGASLGTASNTWAGGVLSELLAVNKGTALTTDANTLLAGSQIGEAANVQLKFGVDSGSTWDLDIVDASNVTLGLQKHNQTGGVSSNGVWNFFPKDNSVSYAMDDTRFGPSAGSFTTDLGTASQPWFDLNFDGTLNDVSDERFKDNIIRNPSDDQLQTNGVSVGDMKTICQSVDLAIFTMIGKDICKYGIIAQDLITEAVKVGVTEDQLVKSGVLKKHFEYETETISEEVQQKETEEVEVEYDDFEERAGKLTSVRKTRTEQRVKTVDVQVFNEQGNAAKIKETRIRTVEKETTDKRGKKRMKEVEELYEVDVDLFVKRPVMKTVTKTYEKFTDVVKEYKYTIDYQHFIRWRLL